MGRRIDNGYQEFSQERGIVWKWAIWGLVLFAGLAIVGSVTGMLGSIFSAPGRVISKTLQTDNIISNYEFFHDMNKAYLSRTAQIASHRRAMATVPADDKQELARFRIEIEGMRQSCRDMVAKYNANSAKINRNIFKGRDAPEELSLERCDA